jgi:hypothetical protein
MRNLIRIGLVVLALCLAAPVAAGPFEDGVAADKRGDYATALRLWRPLADQGDASAQNNLGFMYENGHGVPQDYAEAPFPLFVIDRCRVIQPKLELKRGIHLAQLVERHGRTGIIGLK